MGVDGIVPNMPPIVCPWIIDTLMEIGPSEAGAMGPVPVSWATIDHWQRCIGIDLPPWACRLIRRLSVEFVAEGQRAREADCPPPWTDIAEGHNRTTISRKVSQAFRALIMSKEDRP
ncbi:MAG: hypothetical protein K2W86_00470 [Sphingomonas sp.]|uniref:hypothetical protein n=1 Tax=Sphingomonas sp. TaxID=28214 RepID=UPI0035A90237|nr:hypothetical protein [Sphingomonas sp.]